MILLERPATEDVRAQAGARNRSARSSICTEPAEGPKIAGSRSSAVPSAAARGPRPPAPGGFRCSRFVLNLICLLVGHVRRPTPGRDTKKKKKKKRAVAQPRRHQSMMRATARVAGDGSSPNPVPCVRESGPDRLDHRLRPSACIASDRQAPASARVADDDDPHFGAPGVGDARAPPAKPPCAGRRYGIGPRRETRRLPLGSVEPHRRRPDSMHACHRGGDENVVCRARQPT